MRTLKARIYRQEVEAQISRTQAARKQQVSFTVILLCLLCALWYAHKWGEQSDPM
jgi:hypothetical protein